MVMDGHVEGENLWEHINMKKNHPISSMNGLVQIVKKKHGWFIDYCCFVNITLWYFDIAIENGPDF